MLAAALLPLLWAAAQADEGGHEQDEQDYLDDSGDDVGHDVGHDVRGNDVENVQTDDAVAFSNWGDQW